MEVIGRSSKLPLSLGGRSALAVLERSMALAERPVQASHRESARPARVLQKYNLDDASALIRRRPILLLYAS